MVEQLAFGQEGARVRYRQRQSLEDLLGSISVGPGARDIGDVLLVSIISHYHIDMDVVYSRLQLAMSDRLPPPDRNKRQHNVACDPSTWPPCDRQTLGLYRRHAVVLPGRITNAHDYIVKSIYAAESVMVRYSS